MSDRRWIPDSVTQTGKRDGGGGWFLVILGGILLALILIGQPGALELVMDIINEAGIILAVVAVILLVAVRR